MARVFAKCSRSASAKCHHTNPRDGRETGKGHVRRWKQMRRTIVSTNLNSNSSIWQHVSNHWRAWWMNITISTRHRFKPCKHRWCHKWKFNAPKWRVCSMTRWAGWRPFWPRRGAMIESMAAAGRSPGLRRRMPISGAGRYNQWSVWALSRSFWLRWRHTGWWLQQPAAMKRGFSGITPLQTMRRRQLIWTEVKVSGRFGRSMFVRLQQPRKFMHKRGTSTFRWHWWASRMIKLWRWTQLRYNSRNTREFSTSFLMFQHGRETSTSSLPMSTAMVWRPAWPPGGRPVRKLEEPRWDGYLLSICTWTISWHGVVQGLYSTKLLGWTGSYGRIWMRQNIPSWNGWSGFADASNSSGVRVSNRLDWKLADVKVKFCSPT